MTASISSCRAGERRREVRPESKAFDRRIIGGLGYVGTSSRKLEANLLSVESQVGYVRAMADDERVRAACLTFLERDLRWYYPHRLDLAERCDALASSLGRRLRPPSVPRKYAWIEHAFGLGPANRVQLAYNLWKLTLLGAVDRLAYRMTTAADTDRTGVTNTCLAPCRAPEEPSHMLADRALVCRSFGAPWFAPLELGAAGHCLRFYYHWIGDEPVAHIRHLYPCKTVAEFEADLE